MFLSISAADVVEAMSRFSDMQDNIREFGHSDIHDELIDWQVEDMHRQFPNIDSDQEYVSWFTQIWPRSRTWDQTHRGGARLLSSKRTRRKPSLAATPRIARGGSKRPILRPALFNRLVQRMTELMGERLSWERTGRDKPPRTTTSLGATSARRISMLPTPSSAPPAGPPPTIGPQTARRRAMLGPKPTPVATPATVGPRTRARIAKLQPEPATPAPARSPASLGPRTRTRLMKLGLLKPPSP